jgi:two-component system OmpR family response regulator
MSGWHFGAMNAILPFMNLATRILIVDDDEGIRDLISSFLEKHGFQADTAGEPAEMRAKLADNTYDLIVLDVMMPGEDGLSALRKLQMKNGPPVIMLSAVGTDIDRIVGLEMGAEDYLSKPCNPRELLARIRTVLRRRSADESLQSSSSNSSNTEARAADRGEPGTIRFAGWHVALDARILRNPHDEIVTLSDGEFRLLRAFIEHPRRVLTRDQLLDFAHGNESEHYDRAIDVQISRLRRKLSIESEGAELIRTVRNEGYMFLPKIERD